MRKTRTFSIREPGTRDPTIRGAASPVHAIDNADILQRVERLRRDIERDEAVIRGRSTRRSTRMETAES